MKKFVPRSQRDAGHGPTGPHEGVPDHMVKTLWDWVEGQLVGHSGVKTVYMDLIELELELPLPDKDGGARYRLLENASKTDSEIFLDVIDWLAQKLEPDRDDHRRDINTLKGILALGGSAWDVVKAGQSFQLQRRVDPVVQQAISEATSPSDRASHLLAAAWGQIYGRNPNPSAGYRDAVRAVEAIAKPVILPKDSDATMGKMISALKDKPEKWQVVLSPTRGNPVLAVAEMMELLWKSQLDRHGTDDEDIPINVGTEEAQAAVHIAATLVQLFRSRSVSLAGND